MKYNTKTIDKMMNQLDANDMTMINLVSVINWFEKPSMPLPIIKYAPMRTLSFELQTMADRQYSLLNDVLYNGIYRQDKETQLKYFVQIEGMIQRLKNLNARVKTAPHQVEMVDLFTTIVASKKYVVMTDTGAGRSTLQLVSAAETPLQSVAHIFLDKSTELSVGAMYMKLWADYISSPLTQQARPKRVATEGEIIALADRAMTKALIETNYDARESTPNPDDVSTSHKYHIGIFMPNGNQLWVHVPEFEEIENYKTVLEKYYAATNMPETKITFSVV